MIQDHNQVIEILTKCYPKAFFVESRQRLPLKNQIERDVKPGEIELMAGHPVDVVAAIDWYCGDIGYQKALQAGAIRLDLNGARAGSVTGPEGIAAQARVAEIRKRIAERRQAREQEQQTTPAGRVLQSMRGNNSDDMFKKIDAPPLPKPTTAPPPPRAQPSRNEEIVRRYVAGESSPVIAADYGLSPVSVRHILRAAGVTIRSRWVYGRGVLLPEQEQKIIERYRAGIAVDQIVLECSINRNKLYQILADAEVPLRQPGKPAEPPPERPSASRAPPPPPVNGVDVDGALRLARARIDVASANVADPSVAAAILRTAQAALQIAIERLETP
jgi:sRNA-binding protein/uncharacterized protein (DUF433 family)